MKRLFPVTAVCLCAVLALAGCKDNEKKGPDNSLPAKIAGMYNVTYRVDNSLPADATLMVTKGSDLSAIVDLFSTRVAARDQLPISYSTYVRSGVMVGGEESCVLFESATSQSFTSPKTFINGTELDAPYIFSGGSFEYMYNDSPVQGPFYWVRATSIVSPRPVVEDDKVTAFDPIIVNIADKRYEGTESQRVEEMLAGTYNAMALVKAGEEDARPVACSFLVTSYGDHMVNVALKLSTEQAEAPHNIYLLRLKLEPIDATQALEKRWNFAGTKSSHVQMDGVVYDARNESYTGSFLPLQGGWDLILDASFEVQTAENEWVEYTINASTEIDIL